MSNDYDVFNTKSPEEVAEENRKKSGGNFAEYFNLPPDGTALIRFLDDRPLTFYQHRVWDKSLKNGQGGWRTLTCLRERCRLCQVADDKDKARYVGAYKVVHLDNKVDNKIVPKLKIFLKGINTLEVLERKNRKKPISSETIEVERIGSGFDTKYLFEFTGDAGQLPPYESPDESNLQEIFKPQPELIARIAGEKSGRSSAGNAPETHTPSAPQVNQAVDQPSYDDDIPF